ncbi:hypothetical protein EJ08DRAFT_342496 [Tothia fuscella]|uniref:Uncharacterized protein n=1 Tax=Tothia fuscella TaxID=1048955 RepID=A0A9P4P2D9_9PEZI|nr:hypothetical protein EJ08DRAFT_342496 [Tothia fuscella]
MSLKTHMVNDGNSGIKLPFPLSPSSSFSSSSINCSRPSETTRPLSEPWRRKTQVASTSSDDRWCPYPQRAHSPPSTHPSSSSQARNLSSWRSNRDQSTPSLSTSSSSSSLSSTSSSSYSSDSYCSSPPFTSTSTSRWGSKPTGTTNSSRYTSNPRRGKIMFLPAQEKMSPTSILHLQLVLRNNPGAYSHPILCLSDPDSQGLVDIITVTSLNGKRITEKFDQSRWDRNRYMLIAHESDNESHDGLPLLELTRESDGLQKRSYVCTHEKPFQVEAAYLLDICHNNRNLRTSLTEESVRDVEAQIEIMATQETYQRSLQERRKGGLRRVDSMFSEDCWRPATGPRW